MDLMRRTSKTLGILSVLAFCIWLFLYDDAAQPGPLSSFHQDIQDCTECHEPWTGVSDQQCLECHDVQDKAVLKREIRFHEAERNCLVCHKEHRMMGMTISKMDHTILNEQLACTQCHFDQHDGLFGEGCRQCHDIRTWEVQGYRHPAEGRTDCFKCHRGPASHYDTRFWNLIVEDMGTGPVSQEDCWRCHTIYQWRHLLMEHNISAS